MKVLCFFDYTCRYSYRVFLWLGRLQSARKVDVSWATLSLKQINRPQEEPSLFDDVEIPSVSLFALALAHAARRADFIRYHTAVFDAMHAQGLRVAKKDLLRLAANAGVDIRAFEAAKAAWVSSVACEHAAASKRWGVFGTPTLVLDDKAAVYLKLSEAPPTEEKACKLWEALWTISVTHPELVEIKRPH